MWQDCVDTSLILIEEPYIEPACAEQFKLVMEGAETHVHVKCKPDIVLHKTPVIITSNTVPWRWCNAEEHAFRARMQFYNIGKAMIELKECLKNINPLVWKFLFLQYIVYTDYCVREITFANGENYKKNVLMMRDFNRENKEIFEDYLCEIGFYTDYEDY
ncbi:hypothetical protein DQ401_19455, partial [Morganella morganii]